MIYFTILIYVLAAIGGGVLALDAGTPPDSKAYWLVFLALCSIWPVVLVLGLFNRIYWTIRALHEDYKYWRRSGRMEVQSLREKLVSMQNQLNIEKADCAQWKKDCKTYEEAYHSLVHQRAKKAAKPKADTQTKPDAQ